MKCEWCGKEFPTRKGRFCGTCPRPAKMPEYNFRGFYIPERMIGAIQRYIDEGLEPGHFLTAVICNDLREAVGRADDENMANLPAYVAYFYNVVLPRNCWGSRENMIAWMQMKREARNARHENQKNQYNQSAADD